MLAHRLVHFALGTSAGDLFDEQLGLGYWPTVAIVAGLIALIFAIHSIHRISAIPAFWLAYILTRPLGASIGDGRSQGHADGGLGLGTTITSVLFLVVILALVVYLALSKIDRAPAAATIETGR